MTRYDFSQESANEMLEKADETNDKLTQVNFSLKTRLQQIEAIADEMAEEINRTIRLSPYPLNSDAIAKYEAYNSTHNSQPPLPSTPQG